LHNTFTVQDIGDAINMGMVVVDHEMQVVFWNRWMTEYTQIENAGAINRKLDDLFTEPIEPALKQGIQRTIRYGLPVLLSNALHRTPLPIYQGHIRLDQSIVLSPLVDGKMDRCCLIQIVDASGAAKREKILRANSRKVRSDTVDILTGIANKRAFEEHGSIMLRLAKKTAGPVSIFMIDIDHFKHYVAHYGGAAGDNVLKLVANALWEEISRSTDILARYDGSQFVIMMLGAGADAATGSAERMRQAVNDREIPHAPETGMKHVTISTGVCTCVPEEKDDLQSLIDSAKYALTQTKRKDSIALWT
jgi:diguanylate cyclase (GGDEF)-like protein